MHPTIFQLNAFGRSRLPAAGSRTVLHHLRTGCAACRTALAARLIPWMDEEPAAEARATDAERCGGTLATAYLRAAVRAARAGAKLRTANRGDASVRQTLAILDAEGPAAIGRLPRKLLGAAAIEALLRQTATLGPLDPRLRLRLAELAYDLAESSRDAGRALQQLRCRATIELANACRVALDLGAAQRHLDRAAADLARGGYDASVEARQLQIQASLDFDRSQAASSRMLLSAAMRICRREANAPELARALASDAMVAITLTPDLERGEQLCRDSLHVLGHEHKSLVAGTALMGLCRALERTGRWREGLATLDRHRHVIITHERGRNRARTAMLEGELLGHAGDLENAARAFTLCRTELEAIGQPYEAGMGTLTWAATLERRGERAAAQALVAAATEGLLKLEPHHEVYLALMYLRTANRFSATRSTMQLAPMIAFLNSAEFNPSLRLQSYLSA